MCFIFQPSMPYGCEQARATLQDPCLYHSPHSIKLSERQKSHEGGTCMKKENLNIIELQGDINEIYENMNRTLHFIKIAEEERPLTAKEVALKNYCLQMRSLTAYTMQMLDMG